MSAAGARVWGTATLAIVIAALPAWTGDWIYDDWSMKANAHMDDVGDLLAAFHRTSASYLEGSKLGVETYRPLSMATLIVGRLLSNSPLVHHLFSLALHLITTALLIHVALSRRGVWAAWCVAISFGLHPLGIEAYGWINGRSDALVALGVALLACALLTPIQDRIRAVVALAGAFIAVFAKETGAVFVLTVTVAGLVASSSTRDGRRWPPRTISVPVALAWLATAAYLLMRATLVSRQAAGASDIMEAPGTWHALARLLSISVRSVLFVEPRTMANLGFALAQPMAAADWLFVSIVLLSLLAVVWRRRLCAAMLVAAAVLSVVPSVVLRHAFWHGLDRYLYVPLLLLCLAALADDRPSQSLKQPGASRLRALALTAGAVLLMWSTWTTAQTYNSQAKHFAGMITMRPDDPTGYIAGATWLGRANERGAAAELLEKVQRTHLAPSIASALATQLGELGHIAQALAVVDQMAREHPRDPYAQLDVLGVNLTHHQLAQVLAAAAALRDYPRFCISAREQMLRGVDQMPSSDARRLSAFVANYRCQQ